MATRSNMYTYMRLLEYTLKIKTYTELANRRAFCSGDEICGVSKIKTRYIKYGIDFNGVRARIYAFNWDLRWFSWIPTVCRWAFYTNKTSRNMSWLPTISRLVVCKSKKRRNISVTTPVALLRLEFAIVC